MAGNSTGFSLIFSLVDGNVSGLLSSIIGVTSISISDDCLTSSTTFISSSSLDFLGNFSFDILGLALVLGVSSSMFCSIVLVHYQKSRSRGGKKQDRKEEKVHESQGSRWEKMTRERDEDRVKGLNGG